MIAAAAIGFGATVVGALVGAGASIWTTKKAQESEMKRWYADYFLEKESQRMADLYADIEDCHYTLNRYGNAPPSEREVYEEEVSPKLESYIRSFRLAQIHLDDEEEEPLKELLGSFRRMDYHIIREMPDEEWNGYNPPQTDTDPWHEFSTDYERAMEVMEEILQPAALDNIEDNFGN
ncbi:hypothetical protein [Halorubrum trueperi]|uniref:Uncharacterized protein n=1 Tax=Halorubrum trueperi TaxID=2004704 RepID=A0ABD5UMW7_9EURY